MSNSPKIIKECSLHVGNLHRNVDEVFLYGIFRSSGTIISIRVCRDAFTRKSLGYGYINFQSRRDAEKALQSYQGVPLHHKKVRLSWVEKDSSLRHSNGGNIFIKNLDKSVNDEMLLKKFGEFGEILSCKAQHKRDKVNGVGFVHFKDKASAEKAILKYNNKEFQGKTITIEMYDNRRRDNGYGRDNDEENNYTNVYVKNIKRTMTDKEFLNEMKKYGDVQNASLMKEYHGGLNKGFGFCNFYEHKSAKLCVEKLNGANPHFAQKYKQIFASRAMKKDERRNFLREKFKDYHDPYPNHYKNDYNKGFFKEPSKIRIKKKEGSSSSNMTQVPIMSNIKNNMMKEKGKGVKSIINDDVTNLYVSYLPQDVDSGKLKALFEPYGNVLSARIMIDLHRRTSKCFGFVKFANRSDAEKAIRHLNGKQFGDKYLHVAIAKPTKQQLLSKQYPMMYNSNSSTRYNPNRSGFHNYRGGGYVLQRQHHHHHQQYPYQPTQQQNRMYNPMMNMNANMNPYYNMQQQQQQTMGKQKQKQQQQPMNMNIHQQTIQYNRNLLQFNIQQQPVQYRPQQQRVIYQPQPQSQSQSQSQPQSQPQPQPQPQPQSYHVQQQQRNMFLSQNVMNNDGTIKRLIIMNMKKQNSNNKKYMQNEKEIDMELSKIDINELQKIFKDGKLQEKIEEIIKDVVKNKKNKKGNGNDGKEKNVKEEGKKQLRYDEIKNYNYLHRRKIIGGYLYPLIAKYGSKTHDFVQLTEHILSTNNESSVMNLIQNEKLIKPAVLHAERAVPSIEMQKQHYQMMMMMQNNGVIPQQQPQLQPQLQPQPQQSYNPMIVGNNNFNTVMSNNILKLEDLKKMTKNERSVKLGRLIGPMVERHTTSDTSGKVTGILLEASDEEIVELLNDNKKFVQKVAEIHRMFEGKGV